MLKNIFKRVLPFIAYQVINYETILIFSKSYLVFNIFILKNQLQYQYKMLTCISAVDLLEKQYRFCIIYELLSLTYNNRLRIKVFINETSSIFSIFNLFINSNWWEREIWDLFGIYFINHPDLRRILTDYGFEGYPLRKNFPLIGYIELRYDGVKKQLICEPIELTQEYRLFTFETPW